MSIASTFVPNALEEDEDIYPSGDGEPMAETPVHVNAIILLFQAFQDFLADHLDVYLASNSFWYYEKGNPKARRAPDVMAIKGVGRRERSSFFSWLENGRVPNVIVEVVSPKKRRADLKVKPALYAKLGVNEYFCFDPNARAPKPALWGWRLNAKGVYEPLKLDSQGRMFCQELGLYLKAEGRVLRLIDAKTGNPILSRQEQIDAERQRADDLEREVARLKSQKDRNGGGKRRNGA